MLNEANDEIYLFLFKIVLINFHQEFASTQNFEFMSYNEDPRNELNDLCWLAILSTMCAKWRHFIA